MEAQQRHDYPFHWKRCRGLRHLAHRNVSPGTREIEVGGLEDIDPSPSCERGDCFGKHTMAVAQVHVQWPWVRGGGWQLIPDAVEQLKELDGEEPGWYHLWMCVEHLKDGFVSQLCNCPGTEKAHEKCNCPACPYAMLVKIYGGDE